MRDARWIMMRPGNFLSVSVLLHSVQMPVSMWSLKDYMKSTRILMHWQKLPWMILRRLCAHVVSGEVKRGTLTPA